MTEPRKPRPARRRARKDDGKFRADDPTTSVNEAWEPIEVQEAVGEKAVDYSIKPTVTGPSEPSAGKYQKKKGVRPTFGNITSTSR